MSTQKELMQKAQSEHGLGNSDFFRFDKNGDYRIRQLTPAYPIATYFLGKGIKPKIAYSDMPKPKDAEGNDIKPSVKFICYVIDRNGGDVKLAELPYSVIKVVTDLQEDSDYAFADFPAPYDLKITVNKDAAPADMYKTLPAPQQNPITEQEMSALAIKMEKITPEQYVEKRKNKQREQDNADSVYGGQPTQSEQTYEYPTEDLGEPPF